MKSEQDRTKSVASAGDAAEMAIQKLHNRSSLPGSRSSFIMDNTLPSESEDEPLVHEKINSNVGRHTRLAPFSEESDLESQTMRDYTSYNSDAHRTTNCQTMMHLLKGNIGTGILAIPSSFANAGILLGTLGIPLMGIICVHCMHLIVKCSKILSKRIGTRSLDYAGVSENAFKYGPRSLRPLTGIARGTVNTMLLLTQFGFCCVYFIFVAASLKVVTENLAKYDVLGKYGYLCALLPLMILYNFVRSLRHLALASTFANIIQSAGLCAIFYKIVQDLPATSSRPLFAPLSKLPLFFGTAIYSFEGIGVVLPLENEMKTPEDFGGLTGVLNTGMVMVACLYTAMGFYGYLKYGPDIKGSITLNLGTGLFNESVRLVFALSIFLSYGLQLYVPVQIIWPWFKKVIHLEGRCPKKELIAEYCFRAFLVICTFALASVVNNLQYFISLVGAVASSSLAIIFPAILEIITYWSTDIKKRYYVFMVIKDVAIIIFGVVGFVTGTYASIERIIHCVVQHHSDCEEA